MITEDDKRIKCALRGFCDTKHESKINFESNIAYEKAKAMFWGDIKRRKLNAQKVVILGLDVCNSCGSVTISFRGG